MARTEGEILSDIIAEASQDSCGQPKNPADFHPYRNAWHNNAQREHIYELAMELAALTYDES